LSRFRDVKDTVPDRSEFWNKFSKLPITAPEAGAELNALAELESRYGVSLRDGNIHLIVTDTERGRFVGEMLQKYLKEIMGLSHVKIEEVRGLDFSDDDKFYREGLPRLVRAVARALRGSSGGAYLLPIGGVKNMSSFAMMVGMLMGVPMFFKLSPKGHLYKLPALPVSVDYAFVLRKDVHAILEKLDDMLPCQTFESMLKALSEEDRQKLMPMIERVMIDGDCYVSFSAFGQIVWEATHVKPIVLKHRIGELKFVSSEKEGHSKKDILRYHIDKKFAKIPFVTKVEVIEYIPVETGYIKVRHMDGPRFKVTLPVGGATFEFTVETTADSPAELELAEKELREMLKDLF
jgi:putative CRISPR-associated protein (TIGR02619 family)